MRTSIIRPGLLVSLKTTVRGGVSYEKRDLQEDSADETGAGRVAKWETTRHIADIAEHDAAIVARGKCRTVISRVCCPSSFGLLCPESNESALAAAVEEAQGIAAAHNATARYSRLDVYVITGRIADSDEQAARAIGAEVRELIGAMESGVRAADPAAIREAANKARALAGMLSAETQKKVSAAIAEVRAIATDIVRRVEKSGERAADVVEGVKLEALAGARFAVLDLIEEGETAAAAESIAQPVGRSLEFEPAADDTPAAPDAPAAQEPEEEAPRAMLPALEFTVAEAPQMMSAALFAAPRSFEFI